MIKISVNTDISKLDFTEISVDIFIKISARLKFSYFNYIDDEK